MKTVEQSVRSSIVREDSPVCLMYCVSAWYVLFVRRDGAVYAWPWHFDISAESSRHQPVECSYPVCDRWRATSHTAHHVLLKAFLSPRPVTEGRQHQLRLSSLHRCLPPGRCRVGMCWKPKFCSDSVFKNRTVTEPSKNLTSVQTDFRQKLRANSQFMLKVTKSYFTWMQICT